MLGNQKNKSINVTNNDLILKGSDNNKNEKLNFNIIGNNQNNPVKKQDLIPPTPKSHKIGKKTIIRVSIIVILIIIATVLIIGHFKYGWFKKKNDLIIEQNRQENLVQGYTDKKFAYIRYDLGGEKDKNNINNINNNTVSTDFIVGINKKTKINGFLDFNENDYLYESFLLIINMTLFNETNSEYLGGLNIFDKSKSAEELIKINDEFFLQIINKEKYNNITNKTSFNENIPICKFYYFLNGTIDKIYFPEGMNEFYKSTMVDLIEKITPKLSKSLYEKKDDKRRLQNEQKEGITLNYEKIDKNGELDKIIIYEDKVEKESDEKNKEIKSKIIRTFNSSGDITSLEMKGEAIFKSPSKTKKNDLKKSVNQNLRYVEETTVKDINIEANEINDDFGFNELSIDVTSNTELTYNEIEPKFLEKLRIISNYISFEKYNNSKEVITYSKMKENTFDNISEENPLKQNDTKKRNLNENNEIINFPYIYNIYSTLYDKYFLNTRVMIKQRLYINPNTNLRKDSIILTLGYRERTLDEISLYHNPYDSSDSRSRYIYLNTDDITSIFSVFGYSIGVNVYLIFRVTHGINYSVKSKLMYTRGYASYDVSVGANYGPNFFFISFGAGVRGKFMGGNAYIEGNSISGSSLARFKIYKDFSPKSVDLYFYFTINFIFWKKTFEKTFNIFSINYIFANDYYYY